MRFRTTEEKQPIAQINLMAMASILLVLSGIVALTIWPQEPFVHFNTPTCGGWNMQSVMVDLDVDFDGVITLDGQVMPSQAALESKLLEMKAASPNYEFVVRPNGLALTSSVFQVLGVLERLSLQGHLLVSN
jgi:biopolymer transport protein ExbD